MNTATWFVVLPLVTAPLVYAVGRVPMPADTRVQRLVSARTFSLGIVAALWLLYLRLSAIYWGQGTLSVQFGQAGFYVDGLSLLFMSLSLVMGTLVILYSALFIRDAEQNTEKYYASLIVMIGATFGFACAGDVFNLWIWYEVVVIASCFPLVFYTDESGSLEAGVKYLVQSALGSVLIVLGIALILAQVGTLDLQEIRVQASSSEPLIAAAVLFTTGFGIKLGIVPLHTWIPDAYSQAPDAIAAMFSSIISKIGLIALLRLAIALEAAILSWGMLLIILGVVNIFFGNLFAYSQQQVKRLLAYSSISHIGYIMLGLGIGIHFGDPTGLQGGLLHLITHALMNGLAFMAVGVLAFSLHTRAPVINDYRGMAWRFPFTALALTTALLSLGGIPPLAGFISKLQILLPGLTSDSPLVIGLVIFAGINSVLSLVYYLRIVNALFYTPAPDVEQTRIPLLAQLPLAILTVLLLVLGILPMLVTPMIDAVARAFWPVGG